MARNTQTKTAQGFLPFWQVEIVPPEAEPAAAEATPLRGPLDGSLLFELRSPQEVARCEQEGSLALLAPGEACDLVHLAACMRSFARAEPSGGYAVTGWEPDAASLLEFAQASGPLFGHDDGLERLHDWGRAADAAMLAVRIQAVVNEPDKGKTLGSLCTTYTTLDGVELQSLPRIQAARMARVGAPDPTESFLLCSAVIWPSGQYRSCFSNLPFAQRVGHKPCGHLYSFAQEEEAEGESAVAFYVVCLPHEISAGEFAFLSGVLSLSDDLAKESLAELGLEETVARDDPDAPAPLITAGDDYRFDDVQLADLDTELLSALVRTMTLAHLGGVHIDPFQSSEATGIHSFETMLSWLWYDFSALLSRSRIGYCEKCGRPFSLVGHRGPDRRFCSQKCKTDAKNERSQAQRDAVRVQFFKDPGATVEDIAAAVYEKDPGQNVDRVRASLSSWVELKDVLDDDIERFGFDRSPLFRRCVSMKLDFKKLLRSRRYHELELYLRRTRK